MRWAVKKSNRPPEKLSRWIKRKKDKKSKKKSQRGFDFATKFKATRKHANGKIMSQNLTSVFGRGQFFCTENCTLSDLDEMTKKRF